MKLEKERNEIMLKAKLSVLAVTIVALSCSLSAAPSSVYGKALNKARHVAGAGTRNNHLSMQQYQELGNILAESTRHNKKRLPGDVHFMMKNKMNRASHLGMPQRAGRIDDRALPFKSFLGPISKINKLQHAHLVPIFVSNPANNSGELIVVFADGSVKKFVGHFGNTYEAALKFLRARHCKSVPMNVWRAIEAACRR